MAAARTGGRLVGMSGRATMRFSCHVREIVTRSKRPTLIVTDAAIKDLPVRLQVGDPIQVPHENDEPALRTYIAGVEISTPFDTRDPFSFMLPRNVDPSALRVGDTINFPPHDDDN